MSDALGLIPDDNSAPFFDGCADGKLMLQQCASCGEWSWPVVMICPVCGSQELTWQVSSGRGAIYSFATVHRAFSPAFADWVPYRVVIVDLDEGLRVTTGITGFDDDQVAIGVRVEVSFAMVGGITYPVFAPADTA